MSLKISGTSWVTLLLTALCLHLRPAISQFVAIKSESSTYVCTGVLIDADYIVTNSKCVAEFSQESLNQLDASKVFIHNIIDEQIAETGLVADKIFLPNNTSSSDIALIRVSPPLTNVTMLSIAMDSPKPFTECRMYGLRENRLHYVNVTVIDSEVCNSTHMYNGALAKNVVCTSVQIGSEGAYKCQVNYGSALLCGDQLSGVLSFGSQCVDGVGNLGIYADLSQYQDWVDDVFRTPGDGVKMAVALDVNQALERSLNLVDAATTEVALPTNPAAIPDTTVTPDLTTTTSPDLITTNSPELLTTIEPLENKSEAATERNPENLSESEVKSNPLLRIIDSVLKSLDSTTSDKDETSDDGKPSDNDKTPESDRTSDIDKPGPITTPESVLDEQTTEPFTETDAKVTSPSTEAIITTREPSITTPEPSITTLEPSITTQQPTTTTPEPPVVIITPSNYRKLKTEEESNDFDVINYENRESENKVSTAAPSVMVDKPKLPLVSNEVSATSVTSSTSASFQQNEYCTYENRNCFAEWKFMDIQGYEMTNYRCMNEIQTYSCLYIKRQDVKVKPVGEKIFIQNTHNHYYLINPPDSLVAAPLPIPMLGQKVESYVTPTEN